MISDDVLSRQGYSKKIHSSTTAATAESSDHHFMLLRESVYGRAGGRATVSVLWRSSCSIEDCCCRCPEKTKIEKSANKAHLPAQARPARAHKSYLV